MSVESLVHPSFTVRERSLEPCGRLPWHDHGRPTVCVVVGGEMEEEDRSRTRRRPEGDLVFRPGPDEHRNAVGARGARVVVFELGEAISETFAALGAPRSTSCVRSVRAAHLGRIAAAEIRSRDAASELVLSGICHELVGLALRLEQRRTAGTPEWLVGVRERLDATAGESPSLDGLAETAGVSPHTLSRTFREHYGSSVGEYARRVRLRKALRLLAESSLPLAEVALEAGFYDQSHLTNSVRKETGLTPGGVRKRAAGGAGGRRVGSSRDAFRTLRER